MSGPRTRLELGQKQSLSLTPAMRQSLAVLALSGASLEELIAEAASENPFLLVGSPDAPPVTGSAKTSAYDTAMLTVPDRPSLGEHLCNQIALIDLHPEVAAAARLLAYDLDENGFFSQSSPIQIAAEHGLSEVVAVRAIQALQSCEPTGVAATSLAECIALQLKERGVPPERLQLVIAGLPYFSRGQTETIAPALGLSIEEAQEMTSLVRSLDPAPGRAFDRSEAVVRIPELSVATSPAGDLTVELVNDPFPRLGLDTELARARSDMAENYLSKAQELIRSVKFRGRTLLEVGRDIVRAQEAYFSGRSDTLAPLSRTAIADRLGLHKSTVGRAISNKSLLWRGRILGIERLFPAALAGSGDTEISSHGAQLALLRVIAEETAETVLSDEAISVRLREVAVDISRRTVAKYRKCLNVPPSSARRRQLLSSAAKGRKH